MRSAFRSIAILLLASCPVLMKAVTIRTQDPPPELTTPPATFSFESCRGFFLNGSPVSADGCFQFENETGSDITSLTLTFAQPSGDTSGGQSAQSSIWSNNNAICLNGACRFTYDGGDLADNANLLITEDGVADLSDFGPVTVDFTTATTPEPTSAALLITGLVCLGGQHFQRRRA